MRIVGTKTLLQGLANGGHLYTTHHPRHGYEMFYILHGHAHPQRVFAATARAVIKAGDVKQGDNGFYELTDSGRARLEGRIDP